MPTMTVRVTRAARRANPVIASAMTAAMLLYLACLVYAAIGAVREMRAVPGVDKIARPKEQPSIGPAVGDR